MSRWPRRLSDGCSYSFGSNAEVLRFLTTLLTSGSIFFHAAVAGRVGFVSGRSNSAPRHDHACIASEHEDVSSSRVSPGPFVQHLTIFLIVSAHRRPCGLAEFKTRDSLRAVVRFHKARSTRVCEKTWFVEPRWKLRHTASTP